MYIEGALISKSRNIALMYDCNHELTKGKCLYRMVAVFETKQDF